MARHPRAGLRNQTRMWTHGSGQMLSEGKLETGVGVLAGTSEAQISGYRLGPVWTVGSSSLSYGIMSSVPPDLVVL